MSLIHVWDHAGPAGSGREGYLFFDGGQDVVGSAVGFVVAVAPALTDGQQKPLLHG